MNESSVNLGPLVLSLPAIPQLLILSLIFILSVFLNSLSIISIIGAKAITPINLLIINLSISDILYALTIPMFAVHIVTPSWPFGRLGCQLAISIDIIAMIVGVYTITALSVERYIDVRERNRRSNDELKLIVIIIYIIFLWIFGILFPFPMSLSLFVYSREKDARIIDCRSSWTIKELSHFLELKFVFAYFFPSLIIFIFSFRLILFVHRWSMKSRRLSSTNNYLNLYKRRATTLVLSIIISFFVLWSPFWIFQLYDTFNNRGPTIYIQIFNFVTILFVHTNGLLNPLFYFLLTQNFRDYLKINKCFRWNQTSTNSQIFIYRKKRITNQDQTIISFKQEQTILSDENNSFI